MTKILLSNQTLTINDFNEEITNENKYINKNKNEYYILKYYLKKNNIDIKLIDTIIFNDCKDKYILISKEFINLQKIILNNCSTYTFIEKGIFVKRYYNNGKLKNNYSINNKFLNINDIKNDNLKLKKCKNNF